MNQRFLLFAFWAALVVYFGWDWLYSEPVDIYAEPPVLAIGSGQAPSGAHCSNF